MSPGEAVVRSAHSSPGEPREDLLTSLDAVAAVVVAVAGAVVGDGDAGDDGGAGRPVCESLWMRGRGKWRIF